MGLKIDDASCDVGYQLLRSGAWQTVHGAKDRAEQTFKKLSDAAVVSLVLVFVTEKGEQLFNSFVGLLIEMEGLGEA